MQVDVAVLAATTATPGGGGVREPPRGPLYRFNVINLEMPPSRARRRRSDAGGPLPAQVRRREREELLRVQRRSARRLAGYAGPGTCASSRTWSSVPPSWPAARIHGDLPPQLAAGRARGGIQIPGSTLDEIERYTITKTMELTGGSTSRRPEILSISVRNPVQAPRVRDAPKSARPSNQRGRRVAMATPVKHVLVGVETAATGPVARRGSPATLPALSRRS